jgi:hypothetical protein
LSIRGVLSLRKSLEDASATIENIKTFERFVQTDASHGGVNLIFEAGMYSLANDLERIVKAVQEAGVRFEIVGGVAVNAHIYSLNRRPFLYHSGHRGFGSSSRPG